MKRTIFFSCVLVLAFGYNLSAQKAKKDDDKTKEVAVGPKIRAFLGSSDYSGGLISKRDFDKYLKEGLTAKDSLGNLYQVNGFMFSYGERNLYEDSLGNLIVLTDYLSEWCAGDTVSPAISNNIFYKTKPGDTAYIDQIRVLLPTGKEAAAMGLRFVLTK
ncbi:MAG TPA: hypothetical protein VL093_07210 [Flavipsychrobacter sp.]|jgi:hypothetical protein|nr:hypothetical protein [Flavipsychrobacter sp.]